MSKVLILLLTIFSTTFCVIYREKTYVKEKLEQCLKKENLTFDPQMKELLELYNKGRHYLLGKKINTLYPENSQNIQNHLNQCFKDFGIYNQFVGCNLDCMDKCDDDNSSTKLQCKYRCHQIMC